MTLAVSIAGVTGARRTITCRRWVYERRSDGGPGMTTTTTSTASSTWCSRGRRVGARGARMMGVVKGARVTRSPPHRRSPSLFPAKSRSWRPRGISRLVGPEVHARVAGAVGAMSAGMTAAMTTAATTRRGAIAGARSWGVKCPSGTLVSIPGAPIPEEGRGSRRRSPMFPRGDHQGRGRGQGLPEATAAAVCGGPGTMGASEETRRAGMEGIDGSRGTVLVSRRRPGARSPMKARRSRLEARRTGSGRRKVGRWSRQRRRAEGGSRSRSALAAGPPRATALLLARRLGAVVLPRLGVLRTRPRVRHRVPLRVLRRVPLRDLPRIRRSRPGRRPQCVLGLHVGGGEDSV